jgi:hypothetical protein
MSRPISQRSLQSQRNGPAVVSRMCIAAPSDHSRLSQKALPSPEPRQSMPVIALAAVCKAPMLPVIVSVLEAHQCQWPLESTELSLSVVEQIATWKAYRPVHNGRREPALLLVVCSITGRRSFSQDTGQKTHVQQLSTKAMSCQSASAQSKLSPCRTSFV